MRSKLLKPLEQKIKKLEEAIQTSENLAKQLEESLVTLSQENDAIGITETAKKLDIERNKADSLFCEWEQVSEELESIKEKYPL